MRGRVTPAPDIATLDQRHMLFLPILQVAQHHHNAPLVAEVVSSRSRWCRMNILYLLSHCAVCIRDGTSRFNDNFCPDSSDDGPYAISHLSSTFTFLVPIYWCTAVIRIWATIVPFWLPYVASAYDRLPAFLMIKIEQLFIQKPLITHVHCCKQNRRHHWACSRLKCRLK